MPVNRLKFSGEKGRPRSLERRLPVLRSECEGLGGPGAPCPYVSCRHHLYLEVSRASGAVRLNQPAAEPEELEYSCSLAVADRGGATHEEIAGLLGVSRQAVEQMEARILTKLRLELPGYLSEEYSDERDGDFPHSVRARP